MRTAKHRMLKSDKAIWSQDSESLPDCMEFLN